MSGTMTEFLKIQEICELLRISECTVYDLCRSGKLAGAVKIGGQWRVEIAALEEWVKKGGEAASEVPERSREVV